MSDNLKLKERIIHSYRSDGPFRVFPPDYLKKMYQKYELDPKSLVPTVFGIESLAHFLQEGLIDLFGKLDISKQSKVLSIGEGNGAPSRLLAKSIGCSITGVDLSPTQTANATDCASLHGVESLVKYIMQDVHLLSLEERNFDVVYCNETDCHWENKELAFGRIASHLKHNGMFGANIWLRGTEGDLNNAVDKVPAFENLYDKDIWFQESLEDYCKILQTQGFTIISAKNLTTQVDLGLRRQIKILDMIVSYSSDEAALQGLKYYEKMLTTHGKYLQYGRVIAKKSN